MSRKKEKKNQPSEDYTIRELLYIGERAGLKIFNWKTISRLKGITLIKNQFLFVFLVEWHKIV